MVFDSFSSAKEISLNLSLQSATSAVSAFDRNDFYRLDLKGSSSVNFSLNGLGANANLTLMDTNGQTLAVSNRSGTSAEAINTSLVAGTYYIDVSQVSGSTTYQLNWSSNPAFAINADGRTDLIDQEMVSKGGWNFSAPVSVNNMGAMTDNTIALVASGSDLTKLETGTLVDGANDVQSSLIEGTVDVDGEKFGWNISRYGTQGKIDIPIESNKKTILVAHGRVYEETGSIDELERLAKTAASLFPTYQVLFLDWRSASNDNGMPVTSYPSEAGKRIGAVANSVKSELDQIGLSNGDNLYFYGHSLGALLLTKVAEAYGKVAGIVALDPAALAEEYDLDNDGDTLEDELPDLKSVARNSISLVSSDAYGGWAGDNDYASTANKSYIVNFSDFSTNLGLVDGAYHNAIVDVFSGVLQGGLDIDTLSSDLNIANNRWNNKGMPSIVSLPTSTHEGLIVAQFSNGNSEIEVGGLMFIDQQGQLQYQLINKRVKLAS
jgi:pimeloyl-ACP methyl ester carboxylesterase